LPSQERAGESEVPGDVLVELLAGLVPKGLLAVDLFGGEPLLREDLPEIVRGLSRAGLHVTVTTNGLLLDRERASALVASGLRQLLVSLDGPDAATHDGLRGRKGAFDAARAGIGHYLAAGGRRLGLNMLVCKLNFMQVDQMAELAHSLGARQVRLLPYHQCYPFNQYGQDDSLLPAAEDLPALEEALGRFRSKAGRLRIETNSPSYLAGIGRHFGPGQGEARAPVRCMAGLGVCDLNAFGDLFPCYTLFRRVGNVMRTSFAELWRSQAMTRYREETRDCAACWQSCYIEPGLRLSLRALAADWRSFLRDVRQYGS
jgi:MoaA/NifB/PqqE/SkfB family radical SAM enzyme